MVAIKNALVALAAAATAMALPTNTTRVALPHPHGSNATLVTSFNAAPMCAWELCPYKDAAFDYIIHDEGSRDESHHIRINECGRCQKVRADNRGCAKFKACGRSQLICAGPKRQVADRMWRDNHDSEGYALAKYHVGQCGGYGDTTVFWPEKKF